MESVIRKSLLYKSRLGFYCINHVQGCSHGCRYPCYAYMMANRHGRIKSYLEWCKPRLVANAEELLKKELNRLKTKPDCVHLCLTTDPFMKGYPEVTELSLKLIALINSHGISCSILTKGKLPAGLADRNHFRADNILGISLVSINEEFRSHWEPGAVSYSERINALKLLHERGCKTLVHMEPYPTPNILEQKLENILRNVIFADHIWLGRWNYNPKIDEYPYYREFYSKHQDILRRFCTENNISQD